MTWEFTLTGLLIGVLVGMTGMGGGSLMTPILILLFGFNAKVAVGTDILHGAIFKSFGAVHHRRLGTVHARLAGWMLLGSAPMSLFGVQVANRVGDHSMTSLQKIVGGALIVGGLGFLARMLVKNRGSDAPFHLQPRDRMLAVLIGAIGGFVVGLTSVGSGTFFGLAMLFAYPLTAQKMVGTDLFHAAVLLWVAGISHLIHGDVNGHAMLWLLTGSIPGVLVGSHLSIRVPERELRISFGFILLLSGLKLVSFPQANYVIAVSLGVGVVVLVAWVTHQVRAHRAAARSLLRDAA
ncbi:MAG: sulfite exporter TauE/SafE family protein [Actinomycetes bacterium]